MNRIEIYTKTTNLLACLVISCVLVTELAVDKEEKLDVNGRPGRDEEGCPPKDCPKADRDLPGSAGLASARSGKL